MNVFESEFTFDYVNVFDRVNMYENAFDCMNVSSIGGIHQSPFIWKPFIESHRLTEDHVDSILCVLIPFAATN